MVKEKKLFAIVKNLMEKQKDSGLEVPTRSESEIIFNLEPLFLIFDGLKAVTVETMLKVKVEGKAKQGAVDLAVKNQFESLAISFNTQTKDFDATLIQWYLDNCAQIFVLFYLED